MKKKGHAIAKLMRLHKPVGFILLLLPGLMTLSLSKSLLTSTTVILVSGAFLTRSLGCIINDICDRDIDGYVARTHQRPLASGDLSLNEAYITCATLALASLYLATYIPAECFLWILFTAFMICIYPLSKRFFAFPQVILGLTFGQCVFLTAFLNKASITPEIFALYCAICFWVIAFDTVYALCDYDDDKKLNIFSTVKTLGVNNAKVFSIVLHGFSQSIITILSFSQEFSTTKLLLNLLSWAVYYHISLETYSIKNLKLAIQLFNKHILIGALWILLLA